jgi:class 3 adenylate cyclase
VTTTQQSATGRKPETSDHSDRKDGHRRTSRTVLTRMFVLVAVLAVVVIGVVSFLGARSVFSETIDSQLASVASDRAEAVSDELDRAKADVATVARDAGIALATREFAEAFVELDSTDTALDPSQEQAIDQFYASGATEIGVSTPSDLVPLGSSARYLQFHYIVDNPFDADQRFELVDAQDGSMYSAAHSTYHPMLVERTRLMGAADLLLIGRDTRASVVYSVNKWVDFGTSLLVGPYSDTALAAAVTDQLSSVPVGEAIVVDFEPYVPNGGLPTMFIAASIADQTGIVGAVVVALPRDRLDDVTTFGGRWSDVFLGETGEVYLVGSDTLMRTVSRSWIADPKAYLENLAAAGYSDQVGERIIRYESTVLAQPVDTEAVATALDGETFLGDSINYIGDKTFVFAEPLHVSGLDWVVVSEMSASEARSFLTDYGWSLLLLALFTIPISAIVAYVIARRLMKPVGALTTASDAITEGNVDAQVPDLGRNEYGDLGNRINAVSAKIRASDTEREERNSEIMQVLLAALPPRLVDDARTAIDDGTIATAPDFGDLTDTCTMIAVSVSGYFDLTNVDMESIVDVSSLFAGSVERLAKDTGIERVRSTPDEYVYTAGLRSEGFATGDAMQFVEDLQGLLKELQEDTSLKGEYRIGLSAGRVASGLLRGTELSFGIWGPPVRRALSLVASAPPYQVFIDQTVADELSDEWDLQPVAGIDHGDEKLDAFSVHRSDEK